MVAIVNHISFSNLSEVAHKTVGFGTSPEIRLNRSLVVYFLLDLLPSAPN